MEEIDTVRANRVKKAELLSSMLDLIVQQKERIEAGDAEGLLSIAQAWQKAAAEVTELEKQFNEALGPLRMQEAAAPALAEFAAMDAEAREILLKMQAVQQACVALAGENMGKYADELKDMQKTNQRVVSYTSPYTVSEDGIYFDQKK